MAIILFIVFLAVFLLTAAILIIIYGRQKPIDKLKYFEEDFVEEKKSLKKERISLIKILSNLVPDFKFNKKNIRKTELELIRADVPLTFEELLVIKLLSTFVIVFLIYSITRDLLLSSFTMVIVWNIPSLIILKRKNDRFKMFDSQLTEAIVIISNSLKAGYSFLQALSVVSEQIKEPLGKEFKRLLKEMSLGMPEEEAFRSLQQRVVSEDLNLLINALLIQKDIGGNLSEILDNISETIRERQKIKNELKTLTAQGKLSGLIIGLMPVFLGLVIYAFNKEYIMLLFTTRIGIFMIIASIISEFIGLLFIRKIINIEV
ncbi:Bacterial type II secretion system protein F domain protein [Caloramator mitchellensis]|uniref:Bacterial type II secretion system protein F domain protein n=1 Tax=Caloramator mitchellensis TaxID=908809 RepID=A0A0R3K042_CALMK|nr:type II secretion system F family protein [Caloramator mitchellensis]KRQ86261.1 Bacterial type II secretion system protein F domain protein [Caloramator mitchellensis]